MLNYRAPLGTYSWLLRDVLGAEAALDAIYPADLRSPELFDTVLKEAARLCESMLLPCNRDGDEYGCTLLDGAVQAPPGFRAAYNAFVEGGWIGLATPADHGGQGLPFVLNVILHDMIMATNLSFGDYIGLPQAAAKTIGVHASPELREAYLGQIVAGATNATMCMTEPQCGTDIGLVRTKAMPDGDGFALSGTKIFISAGDHDLTPNIVHLVLARLPDAPPGVKGLSLFLCPKLLADGRPNAVKPVRLERKMGYKAAATCEMHFDNAHAWLVGQPNRGLAAIFTMVNTARLLVSLQGLGTAEAAYQAASAYARERRQGRALTGPAEPDAPADPLIVHPDVRRLLLGTRAFTEAGRFIALWFGLQIDISERHPDQERRVAADDLVGLLTPVVKASFSDWGFRSCTDCMQIFGGHGYIRDTGVEQLVRDVRIAQIQEGANGIQALDFIGRKLRSNGGRAWASFLSLVRSDLAAAEGKVEPDHLRLLTDAADQLDAAAKELLSAASEDADWIGSAGVDFQAAVALLMFGWAWIRILSAPGADNAAMHITVATYFFAREFPRLSMHLELARTPPSTLMALAADDF